jgi:general secretion pathway protein A
MLKYFNLSENPFSTSPNPRFFCLSNSHRSILAKLDYVTEYRQGLAVTYGDIGVGKTTLAKVVMDRLSEKNKVFFVNNPNYKSEMHMIKSISEEMGIGPKRSQHAQMGAFKSSLVDMYEQGISPVLIIDEAQFLIGHQFHILREINNFETTDVKLLQILLFGQLELRNKLKIQKALLSRVIVTSTLDPLSPEELEEMIQFRVRVAGGSDELFPSASIAKIYEASRGLPRDVMKICGLGLKLAHLNKQKAITPDVIDLTISEARK